MKVSLEDISFTLCFSPHDWLIQVCSDAWSYDQSINPIKVQSCGTQMFMNEWWAQFLGCPGTVPNEQSTKNMVQVGWAYYHSLKKTYLQTHNKLKRMLTLLICFPGRGSERENILCFLRSILPLTFLKGLRGQISCRSSSPSFRSSSSWAASWLFVSTVDESTKIWPRIETRCIWRWTVSCLI